MMIYSLCNTCLQPFDLMVEVKDIELIKQVADESGNVCPCPRLCGGSINLVGDVTIDQMAKDPRFKDPIKLSGKELYQAVKGLGLPDEIPKSIEVVAAMLKANPVKDFDLSEVAGKLYLSELRLEGGVVLHLTSGPHGAQVLKMTKERRPNGSGNPG